MITDPPHGPIIDRDYYWPRPVYSRPRWTLALWREGRILTEHAEWIDVSGWDALKAILHEQHLLLYVNDLSMWALKDAAIADKDAEVSADEGGIGSNIFVTYRKKHYHVMEASAWGIDCSLDGLRSLRTLLTLGGVGDYPSAGGWGQAQMRLYYPRAAPRLPNLSRRYWDIFKNNMVGGRVDGVRLGQRFDTAYEYDQNSAYANAMLRVPAGTIAWWDGSAGDEQEPDAATAYLRCTVTIPDDLTLSPLPRRDDLGIVHYDNQEGQTFNGWFWLEEIQTARVAGIAVACHSGLTWTDTDDRFRRWVETMDMLRRRNAGDPTIAGMIKRATVAAIGRFAQAWDVSTVTTEPADGDEPLTDPNTGPMNPYYIHREERPRPGLIPYLFSHASATCRVETYLVAKAAMDAGTLIGTNYDAVFTSAPLAQQPLGVGIGEWKEKTLTDAAFPTRRAVLADGVIKLPGLTGEVRAKALRDAGR